VPLHLQTDTVGVAEEAQVLPSDPPKKLTPAPAKVIFDVEANTNGRLGLPAAAARPRTSIGRSKSCVNVCTA
jgi:hypothetical protein